MTAQPARVERPSEQVSVEEIEQNLAAYLRRVEAGETFVVTRAGKPLAELKPALACPAPLRPFGLCAGEFTVSDDFDAPLPEDLLRELEGG
jgi:prevent-host-death family protein